jgi:hypothetical protein
MAGGSQVWNEKFGWSPEDCSFIPQAIISPELETLPFNVIPKASMLVAVLYTINS